MEFREVTIDNLNEVIALKVSDAQEGLVADNLYTVAQVGLVPDTRCCGVYVDDVPDGFSESSLSSSSLKAFPSNLEGRRSRWLCSPNWESSRSGES